MPDTWKPDISTYQDPTELWMLTAQKSKKSTETMMFNGWMDDQIVSPNNYSKDIEHYGII